MMRTHSSPPRTVWLTLFVLGCLCCSQSIVADPTSGVQGRVLDAKRPVEKAKVYAYEVASFDMLEVETDRRGRFLFDRLPAGMYKLIAFKPGFQPTVELLLRRTTESLQELEIELQRNDASDVRANEDYWSVRGRVPADVLRQIQQIHAVNHAADGLQIAESAVHQAHMQALSGVQDLGGLSAQHMAAAFDVRGSVGSMKLGIDGRYESLTPRGSGALDGEVRSVAVKLASANEQRFRLATSTGQLDGLDPVDLQHYQLDWTGRTGASGETHVSARYTEESGYHRNGFMAPAGLPAASETWDLEGVYLQEIGSAHTLRTGLSYRQRTAADALFFSDDLAPDELTEERLGLFGVASSQIQPRVLVEYGLYSTVRDGSLSLMPRGGIVVELGSDWRAEASAAQRIETDDAEVPPARTFDTAFFSDRDGCYDVGESCYEVSLARGEGENQVRIGAIHREYAETLRVYFSPDFFDRLESVFMVEGDELPELRLALARRIAPKVVAKLESNYASGGGGIFYATDDSPYENNVRYLVTSLDTQFQATQTGVFVAFHHLEQSFDALGSPQVQSTHIEMQRLQLMLTQDLSALVDLASRWAVRLNMELSRGATPYTLTADDEVHKKLTGGFAVSF